MPTTPDRESTIDRLTEEGWLVPTVERTDMSLRDALLVLVCLVVGIVIGAAFALSR